MIVPPPGAVVADAPHGRRYPLPAMSAAAATKQPVKETPKQAAIGLLISFVMVLLFRGFFFETFHIPTGSMAPTLNGQHLRFESRHTGFAWAVNPWDEFWAAARQRGLTPTGGFGAVAVTEPISGLRLDARDPLRKGGDRIGIVKYNPIYRPHRWDVIVMRWPQAPDENYIKRLVGMPGERVWFVDGDVFVSDVSSPADKPESWRIVRKPESVQRAVWWPVYSSESAPIDRVHDGRTWSGPWVGDGWDLSGRSYTHAGAGEATLRWDTQRWPVTDWSPYNDVPIYIQNITRFPVSDVRLRFGVEPKSAACAARAVISARGQEFRAVIEGGSARLQRRDTPDAGADAPWADVGQPSSIALREGRVTDVELWHADQAVTLYVGGVRVARHEYAWTPMERLRRATTLPAEALDALLEQTTGNPLANPTIYAPVGVRIEVAGAVTLHRVGLDRDLHYQAAQYRTPALAGKPALGTHPSNLPTLSPQEYFFCGDNSANSTDSRLVDSVDPWVAARLDARLGVVHERLIKGKAMMVFWPAAQEFQPIPAFVPFPPDFGRMRFIR